MLPNEFVACLAASAIEHAGDHGFVTLSVGLACAEASAPGGVADVLAAADAALYDSKSAGRNRITVRAFTPAPAAAPG